MSQSETFIFLNVIFDLKIEVYWIDFWTFFWHWENFRRIRFGVLGAPRKPM